MEKIIYINADDPDQDIDDQKLYIDYDDFPEYDDAEEDDDGGKAKIILHKSNPIEPESFKIDTELNDNPGPSPVHVDIETP